MILNTAWKNVWRNQTRSLVVIVSMTIGVFAGIFGVGLMTGTINQRLDSALNQEIGHIHINKKNFNDNFDIQLTLDDVELLNTQLLNTDGVEAVANRVVLSAMANTATKSMGIQLIGVNPEQEKAILDLDQTLLSGTGSYFEKETSSNMAYIGQDLAKELNIIRFRIEASTIDSLRSMEVPEETLLKLEPFIGKRFASQKVFTKTMKQTLTAVESHRYGENILNAAWSFRARSKMTLTFLDKNNIQTGAMFRIAGIYDIKNAMYEKMNVFVLNSDLRQLAALGPEDYHQTIIRVNDLEKSQEIAALIHKNHRELEIKSWKEISTDLAMMVGMVQKFHAVFMVLILAALSFGIINTMLMVVLERTKELGMLTAIGMNKKKVFTMIMSETVFLSLIGGIAGMLISKIFISFTAVKGINFTNSAEGFEAMGFSAHIYPSVSGTFYLTVTILIVLTGILSSIYPALKALRLDPAEALRTE
ncbi:MAG: FtsX-like permease family protein [Bacteroidales bacterium]|jgi:ABC-type lipoprotein release transport system permease subunit|nr:FtsX-like permease family protein [Bacteroidales bacterium]